MYTRDMLTAEVDYRAQRATAFIGAGRRYGRTLRVLGRRSSR